MSFVKLNKSLPAGKSLEQRRYVPASSHVTGYYDNSVRLQRESVCVCGGQCPACQSEKIIQKKSWINSPDDEYEKEANQVANRVMQMPDPVASEHEVSGDEWGQQQIAVKHKPGKHLISRKLDFENDFDDCDRSGGTAEREMINSAQDKAIELLRHKTKKLIDDPGSYRYWLKSVFRIGDLDKAENRKKLDRIIHNLVLARIGLQMRKFRYECDYDEDINIMCRSGDYAAIWAVGDVHICPLFFTKDELGRADTIIHEALHEFSGAGDESVPVDNTYYLSSFVISGDLTPIARK